MKPRITIDKEEYDKLVAMQPETVTTTWHLSITRPGGFIHSGVYFHTPPVMNIEKFGSLNDASCYFTELAESTLRENEEVYSRCIEIWGKLHKAENMSWFNRVFRFKKTLAKL